MLLQLQTVKMKKCFCQIAPIVALPCNEEERRMKRKSKKREPILFFLQALRFKKMLKTI